MQIHKYTKLFGSFCIHAGAYALICFIQTCVHILCFCQNIFLPDFHIFTWSWALAMPCYLNEQSDQKAWECVPVQPAAGEILDLDEPSSLERWRLEPACKSYSASSWGRRSQPWLIWKGPCSSLHTRCLQSQLLVEWSRLFDESALIYWHGVDHPHESRSTGFCWGWRHQDSHQHAALQCWEHESLQCSSNEQCFGRSPHWI